MKPSSAKGKGERTCRRCSEPFTFESGDQRICSDCRQKCSSCDQPLTVDNQHKSSVKLRKNFVCSSCVNARVKRTRGNKGFCQRSYDYKRHYGITMQEYEDYFRDQNGQCAICKTSEKKLCVDHCHSTGKVRGLLCSSCNNAIGLLGESVENLNSAIKYLKTR